MRGGTPLNTIEGVTDGIIANSGCVGSCLQCAPRTTATSRQATGEEREVGERYNTRQHQEFFWGGEEDAPPEEAERVSTGGNDRTKLKTAALPAHGVRAPGCALAPAHTGDISCSMPRQSRAVCNLHPEFGHDADIIQHEALVKHLANLHTPGGGTAPKDQVAEAVTRPQPGQDKQGEQDVGQNIQHVPATTDREESEQQYQYDCLPGPHRSAPLSTTDPRARHQYALQNFIQDGSR